MGRNMSHFSSVVNGPVEKVTWYDALLYCNKRSQRDGLEPVYSYQSAQFAKSGYCKALNGLKINYQKNGYRLPTEAEWEYACKAGSTTDYYWGNDTTSIDKYAWLGFNSVKTTHAVATKLPNAFGLYDMNGNVWEWNNDLHGPMVAGPVVNPTGTTIAKADSSRCNRGGGWYSAKTTLRTCVRDLNPGAPNIPFYDVGFRVVLPARNVPNSNTATIQPLEPLKRRLIMGVPDGAQGWEKFNQEIAGYFVLDIDDEFKFLEYVEIPTIAKRIKSKTTFNDGTWRLRGFNGNLFHKSVFYAGNSFYGRFDLEKKQVVYDVELKPDDWGYDRTASNQSTGKIIVSSGWWPKDSTYGLAVIDPQDGKRIKNIKTGQLNHNTAVGGSGKYYYSFFNSIFRQFDMETDKEVRKIVIDTFGLHVSPFTIDSKDKYAYICDFRNIGFFQVDLQSGKVVRHVQVTPNINFRSHGIALTPDEKEIWLVDQNDVGNDPRPSSLFVFDNTVAPQKEIARIPLGATGHGWVNFTRDGKYAICHSEDIIDTKTKKIVFKMKDHRGYPIRLTKFFESWWRGDKLVWIGSEFGLGLKGIPYPDASGKAVNSSVRKITN